MLLGDAQSTAGAIAGDLTLDALFRRAALRRPSNFALIDPPDRRSFANGAARYVSYAAADRMVSAIAGRLQRLELPRDAVVGLQCVNVAEGVLAMLGVQRAGLIPALLPLLWRRDEMVLALSRLGAKAIIAGGRIAGVDLCDAAMNTASELFAIRYVCGFGDALADGVIALGELFTLDRLDPIARRVRDHNAAAHVAAITWDMTAQGPVPVARSHAELIAGGMAVMLAGRIAPEATILSAQTLSSFAGLSLNVLPWLLTGGTLVLHQPFAPQVMLAQCSQHRCNTVVLPGSLLPALSQAGLFHDDLGTVLAVWRAPERMATSPAWHHPRAGIADVAVFGEVGLIAARRDHSGLPAPLRPRPETETDVVLVEAMRSGTGTLALRGAMVPRHPFPPGAAPNETLKIEASGFVDTGYPCRAERDGEALQITGPPAGIVSVGGYRFVQRTLHEQINSDVVASITALPDDILGHRLAGSASDREAVQQALRERGVNPLVVGAFRDRRRQAA